MHQSIKQKELEIYLQRVTQQTQEYRVWFVYFFNDWVEITVAQHDFIGIAVNVERVIALKFRVALIDEGIAEEISFAYSPLGL